MEKSHIYLTPDEYKVLTLLSQGVKSSLIQKQCTIPVSGLGFFTAQIRQKTGIFDTRSVRECRDYLADYSRAMAGERHTDEQIQALRLYAKGMGLSGIANTLQLEPATLELLLTEARKRAGIFASDEKYRRIQVRIFLAANHPLPGKEFRSVQLKAMQMLADGMSYGEISKSLGQLESYIRLTVREACARLGLNARGRNVQRQLLRAYLTAQSAKTEDLMADPCF